MRPLIQGTWDSIQGMWVWEWSRGTCEQLKMWNILHAPIKSYQQGKHSSRKPPKLVITWNICYQKYMLHWEYFQWLYSGLEIVKFFTKLFSAFNGWKKDIFWHGRFYITEVFKQNPKNQIFNMAKSACLQCISEASTGGTGLSSPFLLQIDTFGKWLRYLTNVCYVKLKKLRISGQTQIIWVQWSLWWLHWFFTRS